MPFINLAAPTLIPAVIVCILFLILEVITIYRLIKTRSTPYRYLATFGLIRTVAYACRSAWAEQSNPLDLTTVVYIAEVLQSAGFVIIIFTVYSVLTLWVQVGLRGRGSPVPPLEARAFRLIRLAILAFQILSIVAVVGLLDATTLSGLQTAQNERYASTYGVFAIGILQVILTIGYYSYFVSQGNERVRFRECIILEVISLLALIELTYKAIAISAASTDPVNTVEAYTYGFIAAPELLIMTWCAVFNLADFSMENSKVMDTEYGMRMEQGF